MSLLFNNQDQLGLAWDYTIDTVLLSKGYDNMSVNEKNNLIAIIAFKNGLSYDAVTPSYLLDYHKTVKKNQLDQQCNTSIVNGFISTNGHTYTLDVIDQINMLAQKQKLNDDSTITTVSWKAEDVGDWIPHTRDEWLINVYGEGYTFVENQRVHCKALKKQVTDALDHPTVMSIVWA